jgi:RNA polymerase sigma-70 factor (ECF subfamily)
MREAVSQPRDVKALEREALGHCAALYRLAARLLGNAADADDVVQEAFVKAISELRRGGFRGDSALSTWLYRVVTNVALDRLRQVKRQAVVAPEAEPAAAASPEAAVALRELTEAMQELPEDQRAALVLKELQGLPTRDVALILERSEGATEQLLVRARQTLRRRFEP